MTDETQIAVNFTLPAAAFAGAFLAAADAAGTDWSRPILCRVLLEREATGLRLVGCDSYRMNVVDMNLGAEVEGIPAYTPMEFPQWRRMVDVTKATTADVKRVCKAAGFGSVVLSFDDHAETLTLTAGTSVAIVPMATEERVGDYPKYRGLIPGARRVESGFALNAKYLGMTSKAVETLQVMVAARDKDASVIRLVCAETTSLLPRKVWASTELKPVLFQSNVDVAGVPIELLSLIMPARVDANGYAVKR